jgi:hypothetical protein
MAYKLKIKHNLGDSVVLPVTLTYDDPGQNLKPINISLKNSYATEYRLWDDIDDLDVNKIKIVESNMVIGNITYKFDPSKITITKASSGGESGGESGGGTNPSGGESGGGSNPSGGESGGGSGSGTNPSGGESGGGSNPSGGESGGSTNPSGSESGGESGGESGSNPTVNKVAITYNTDSGDMLIYPNGKYGIEGTDITENILFNTADSNINSVTVNNQVYDVKAQAITVNGSTVNRTVARIPVANFVQNTENTITATYSDNSNSSEKVFAYADEYEALSEPMSHEGCDVLYDVQNGAMRLYSNGYYRTMGENGSITGNLIPELNNNDTEHILYISYRNPYIKAINTDSALDYYTKLEYSSSVETVDEFAGLKYVDISINDLMNLDHGQCRCIFVHDVINGVEDNTKKYIKTIGIYDSAIKISFKPELNHKLDIDRSKLNFNNQLPFGTLADNYVDVTIVGNPILCNSVDDLNLYFGVECDGWHTILVSKEDDGKYYIKESNIWEPRTEVTKLYVGIEPYGACCYYDYIDVRLIQSSNFVPIRGMDVEAAKIMYIGETYTLRRFIVFEPSDASFSDFMFKFPGTDRIEFDFYGSTALSVSKNPKYQSEYPKTWDEFLDEYLIITPVQETDKMYITLLYRTYSGLVGHVGDQNYKIKSK